MDKNHFQYQETVQKEITQHGYVYEKVLGQGQFGMVILAHHKNDKELPVAIKSINKHQFLRIPKLLELTNNEINVLSKIKNQNVLKMYEHFETEINHYLVTEFCNSGDMGELLWEQKKKKTFFTEQEAIEYFSQILNGFQALHELSIVHRDIKLDNILRHKEEDGSYTLKIGDLGFAKELQDQQSLTTTSLGTAITKAPEVIEKKPYGLEVDLYSCGVILYQMLFGQYPFMARNEQELLVKIKQGKLNFHQNGIIISNEAQDLIFKMLQYNRKRRIKWGELYNHKLFQKKEVADLMLRSFGQSYNLQTISSFYNRQELRMSCQFKGYYEKSDYIKIMEGQYHGDKVCIKEIKKQYFVNNPKDEFSFNLMKDLQENCDLSGTNIMQIFKFNDQQDSIFLIQELCPLRSLEYQVQTKKKLIPEHQVLEITLQILNALKFLHSKNLVYRNLSAQHVLLHENAEIRLTGLNKIKELNFQQESITKSIIGNSKYQPPELMQETPYDINVDIHSLGILMYYLICGQYPFSGIKNESVIASKEKNNVNYDRLQINNKPVNPYLVNLIQQMLMPNPFERITYTQIFEHPIFKIFSLTDKYNFQDNYKFYQQYEVQKITLPEILTKNNISNTIKNIPFYQPPKTKSLGDSINLSNSQDIKAKMMRLNSRAKTNADLKNMLLNENQIMDSEDEQEYLDDNNQIQQASFYIKQEAEISKDLKKYCITDDSYLFKNI